MKPETVITVNDLPPDVIEAVKSGNKIEAIKRLRSSTGLGLANAKVLVDAAARRYRPSSAHSALVEQQGGSQGLLVILLLAVGAYAAYRYFMS